MIPVISVGSVKTSGTTTLAMTLAAVAAAAEIPVVLIDASRDRDLLTWSRKTILPPRFTVEATQNEEEMEQLVRAARRRGDAAIIDAGSSVDTIRMAARLSDRSLIPVRFSPVSAAAALLTDTILGAEADLGRRNRTRLFVASAVTHIPSRIARSVEQTVQRSSTPRAGIGLVQRSAYEAPFLYGGTIFTLPVEVAPGLDRARAEAASLAFEIGILGRREESASIYAAGLREAA
ncbi:hypothetical protein [Aurantimonas sp. Leaf443]|uniref:hypothetical protein n=1 Tax=Aurantimonas sp. Leaf443 TaxID=1736378 RepID=UPI0006F8F104|nr:hypothetical protein [Aurantimonas sp. Leaf443]KQT85936.1 chromosome partitioning protein ParA [Aurantimonas sp. Leaf443]